MAEWARMRGESVSCGRKGHLHTGSTACCKRMLDLNKRKAAEKNPNILQQLETRITTTDRQIDRLVYEPYGLTEAEAGIVDPAFVVPTSGATAGKGGRE